MSHGLRIVATSRLWRHFIIRCLKSIIGIHWWHKVIHVEIRHRAAGIDSAEHLLLQRQLRWVGHVIREAKRRCRCNERRYRRSQSATDRQAFQAARATARAAITRSRTDATKQRFDEAPGDVAATWHVVRDVLHRDQ